MHEKGLQRQKSVGPLVSSQERRAAVVPRINRLSTGCQPRALCSPIGLHRISLVRPSEESFRTGLSDALEGTRGGRHLGDPIRRRPILPGPAPPRRPAVRLPDPTRPWYVKVLDCSATVLQGLKFRCYAALTEHTAPHIFPEYLQKPAFPNKTKMFRSLHF